MFDVYASTETLAELEVVLMRTNFNRCAAEHIRREFFVGFQHRVRMFDIARTVTDCPDPKDNKFLELAETSGAELIIANDPHLTERHPWREIPIMPPAAFLVGVR